MNTNREKTAESIAGLLTGIFVFVLWAVTIPFATIWSLNTLFSLGIPYTFWTWLAAVFMIPMKRRTLMLILNPKRVLFPEQEKKDM